MFTTRNALAEAGEKPASPLALKGGGLRRVPKGQHQRIVMVVLAVAVVLLLAAGALGAGGSPLARS